MTKVCVIGVYFGQLPNYFKLWMKSCEFNSTIDFYIITDNKILEHPSNVKVINLSLKEMKKLAEKKIGMQVCLDTPYKCCDYKPVYGLIFEDYIGGYDYWGHCDFDMLFGDLRNFFEKYHLEEYDKFLPLGHLAFYKNTDICNKRFLIEPKSGNSYKKSFATETTTQFDELGGINAIYNEGGFPFFKKRIFVDVSIGWKRIKCAEFYIDPHDSTMNSHDKNYKYQLFVWDRGKIKRYYIENEKVLEEDFAYIHIKKRKFEEPQFDIREAETIYICPDKFVRASAEEKIDKKMIQKYNHNYGRLYEYLEYRIFRKIKARLKSK